MRTWLPALLFLALSHARANAIDVEFSETALADAIRLLQERTPGNPQNVIFDPGVDPKRTVTLALKDVPPGGVFSYLLDQAGYDYRREAHALVVIPPGEGELARRPAHGTAAALSPMAELAKACLLEQTEFVDTPLVEALRYLSLRSAEVHPEGRTLNLVVSRNVDGTLPVFLKLRQVTAAEVLRHIGQLTGVETRVEPWAIFIDAPGSRAARERGVRSAMKKPGTGSPPSSRGEKRGVSLGTSPDDPRSPAHPDYVHSTVPDLRMRTNALNNVYRWKNGKWTFVRHGGGPLDAKGRRIVTPTLSTAKLERAK